MYQSLNLHSLPHISKRLAALSVFDGRFNWEYAVVKSRSLRSTDDVRQDFRHWKLVTCD